MPDRVFHILPSGREELPPAPEPSLEEMIAFAAKRITAIERLIAKNEAKAREYEAEYLALKREMVDGYTEAAARLTAPLADAEATLLELLKRLPDGKRRYRHGRCTFGISAAKKSIEIVNDDEEAAVAEIEALGKDKADDLIRIKKAVKKKELLTFIEKGDSPEFEYIRVNEGSDSLRRSFPR